MPAEPSQPRAPVFRVLHAALASRLLVLTLALVSNAWLDDYDSSARYDVPDTAARCELSDGDEKFPQARQAASASRAAHREAAERCFRAGFLQHSPGAGACRAPLGGALSRLAPGWAGLGLYPLPAHRAMRLRDGEVARLLPAAAGAHARRAGDA